MVNCAYICFGVKLSVYELYNGWYPWGNSFADSEIEAWWNSLPGYSDTALPVRILMDRFITVDSPSVIICIKASVLETDYLGPTDIDINHFTKVECIEDEGFTRFLGAAGIDDKPKWMLFSPHDR